jgi:hypothetical protein
MELTGIFQRLYTCNAGWGRAVRAASMSGYGNIVLALISFLVALQEVRQAASIACRLRALTHLGPRLGAGGGEPEL